MIISREFMWSRRGPGLLIMGVVLALLFGVLPLERAEAACSVPNTITNGQVADATAVMGNFNALKGCVDSALTPSGTPSSGNLATFSSSGTITNGNLSGDCATTGTMAVVCTKTNGSSFGALATSTDASQLTGTVSVNRFNGGTNADSAHFLRGDGVWATPSGGGGGSGQPWYIASAPIASSFTLVSGDGTNLVLNDDADEGLQFDGGATVSGDKWRAAEKTISAPAADWMVTAKVDALLPGINWRTSGIYVRDSVGGRILALYRVNGNIVQVARIAGLGGTFNSAAADTGAMGNYSGWMRVSYTASDNTYRFYYSLTGKRWALLGSEVQTTFLANKADRVGFGVMNNSATGPNVIGAVQYWQQSW